MKSNSLQVYEYYMQFIVVIWGEKENSYELYWDSHVVWKRIIDDQKISKKLCQSCLDVVI